jgi:hypothetical protein
MGGCGTGFTLGFGGGGGGGKWTICTLITLGGFCGAGRSRETRMSPATNAISTTSALMMA